MLNTSLYQEAIAEAKQLRETAEVNAKNAIIEAVTPKIRQFIENQLLNEQKDPDNQSALESVAHEMFEDAQESLSDEVVLDESALSALIELMSGNQKDFGKLKNKTAAVTAINEALKDMSNGDRHSLQAALSELQIEGSLVDENIVINENSQSQNFEEIVNMSNVEKDATLYEVDLDEIAALLDAELSTDSGDLNELDATLTLTPDGEDEVEAAAALDDLLSDLEIDVEVDSDAETDEEEEDIEDLDLDLDFEDEEMESEETTDVDVDIDVEEDEVETMDEVLEIDLDMLKNELRKIRLSEADSLASAGKAHKMSHVFGGKDSDHPSGDDFGGGKRGKDALQTTMNQIKEAYKKEGRKNRVLSEKLNEYRSAVKTLREQLTEMNLFNAKLLYVNKLLQNNNVTPPQRRNIIEALDDARTLREVKLLFKSLTQSLVSDKPKKQLSESVRRTLGSASRPVQSSSSSEKSSDEVNRWTQLAGLHNK